MPRTKTSKNPGQHSDHLKELSRFARIKGQLEGVEKMINEKRYCGDILNQLRAIKSGIAAIEASILETHLHSCVSDAIRSKKEKLAKEKIDEIINLFKHSSTKGVILK